MRKLIATIPKNAREEIRVALDEFETKDTTYDMVSVRVFYEDGGEYRPGRNGLNVRVDLLPPLWRRFGKWRRKPGRRVFSVLETKGRRLKGALGH